MEPASDNSSGPFAAAVSQPRDSATRTQPPSDRIAGWMPAGMLDWPGKVSATVFLAGCQLRCPYCHNPSLIAPFGSSPAELWRSISDYLERRADWIDGVVITGGEPTLDPGLEPLLGYLKARRVPVKLDTNGMRPDLLRSLLYRELVDHVALDIKALPEDYGHVATEDDAEKRIRTSIRTVLESGIEHEFRTTCYPGLVGPDDMKLIAQELQGGRSYMLQQFRPDTTLHAQAAQVEPYSADTLKMTAAECSTWIPTAVRGA